MDRPIANKKNKQLNVNFDEYTYGDSNLKRKLIFNMIDNLIELLQAYDLSINQNSSDIFRSTAHKITSTISILDDAEFTLAIDYIKTQFYMDELTKRIDLTFKNLSYDILRSLAEEGSVC